MKLWWPHKGKDAGHFLIAEQFKYTRLAAVAELP